MVSWMELLTLLLVLVAVIEVTLRVKRWPPPSNQKERLFNT